MKIFPPSTLAAWSGGRWLAEPTSGIRGFCFDSRKIAEGDLFVALKSDKADGRDYIANALAGGAAAALAAPDPDGRWPDAIPAGAPLLAVNDPLRAFQRIARGWRDEVNPFVVGVTGSVGKSTVKEWTAAILADWRHTAFTAANFNNDIGLPASILAMAGDAAFGVFEAGMSHPGDMAPLCRTMRPNAAIVTCIAPVHIEFFDALAGIAEEKAELLRSLPPDGFAVLDARGDFFEYLAGEAPCRVVGACVVREGEHAPAPAQYVARLLDEATCRIAVSGPGLAAPECVELGRPGAHNALNAILAAAAARECGVPWDIVLARLRSLPSMALRWERFSRLGYDWVCDAYNASPASMAASIRAFAMAVPAKGRTAPRAFVLGDMFELGAGEVEYHRGIGQ
ncbi:MAG: UDP-N-acetylmuramoyl-tripeptide--D-alanyl-D-alanine ligase, partial [Kiritimatiellae bacterium]|nr:UDP-N-acetylmuramoyl-tripeptide--D-alanyl-D-alanine ligase [Kiritimatiellia bacterium]